ncbi:uncharacterized protein LOC126734174 [Anthonomus grandis grandis]|uniref:uncharacterized protein LOC126734174 n=1 Tax=Anthonomus grandis grandis TaxID=2921223 RepID=UPI0021668B26|nr:uncharacterized protein LOC126734174 [Anthonomus grandis grandis]
MEFEFGKHFKDATNLLLMMDHDSGYVEGESSTSSSIESAPPHKEIPAKREPDNFLLSEDALLERPELYFDLSANLPPEIDREDQIRVFSSPDIVTSSVPSQNSVAEYSGLENDSISSSQRSGEIPLIAPIEVAKMDVCEMVQDGVDNDILMISATESDMSLEQTFDPVIVENSNLSFACCSHKKAISISPSNGIIKQEGGLNHSVIAPSNSEGLNGDKKEHYFKEDNEEPDKEQSVQESLNSSNQTPSTPNLGDPTINSKSTNKWSVTKSMKPMTPSKANHPLAPLTNTFDFEAPQFIPKDKKRLTLIFSKAEKENLYSVKRKFPSLTPEKSIDKSLVNPDISPDIFDGEDLEAVDCKTNYFDMSSVSVTEEPYIEKLDKKLLKRVQNGMNGVLPPPSVTVIHMSAQDILNKLDENKSYFFWNKPEGESSLNSSGDSGKFCNSLLLSVGLDEAMTLGFPEASKVRCHGLHYNCGKISEEIVDMCEKYQKRFVGAETQSTCTTFETQNSASSPTKRKSTRPKWGTKSPGRRLSHLARRRITFSSSNLQAGGGSALAGSRARQILVDAKKIDLLSRRRSPRKTPRKTPTKSPKVKTRTPSSSAKKKLAMRFRKLTGEIEKSVPSTSEVASSVPRALFRSPAKSEGRATKRALFQSPNRDNSSSLNMKSKSQNLHSLGDRSQSRRNLFPSPRKHSPLKQSRSPFKRGLNFGYEKKRKRSESDDVPASKFPRSMSMDVKPSTSVGNRSICRTQSELNISGNKGQNELSEQHKKKLLWAVSIALQSQNITSIHPQWKTFASVLARVTRRFYANQLTGNVTGGTSERMQRIAKYHVISVIKGKSADEIISEYLKNRANSRVQKPQGYVAPQDYEANGAIGGKRLVPSGGKENVFQDRANTLESWEKRKLEEGRGKSTLTENKIERIRKVINFGDDDR